MTNKQYTKEEAEELRSRVLDAAREAKKSDPEAGLDEACNLMLSLRQKNKHYHRKIKKKRWDMQVIVPADGDLKKWLES